MKLKSSNLRLSGLIALFPFISVAPLMAVTTIVNLTGALNPTATVGTVSNVSSVTNNNEVTSTTFTINGLTIDSDGAADDSVTLTVTYSATTGVVGATASPVTVSFNGLPNASFGVSPNGDRINRGSETLTFSVGNLSSVSRVAA